MNKAGVKCERLDEPKKVKRPLVLPIAVTVAVLGGVFWTFNHVYGGCTELNDVFSYCSFHTK